MSTILKALRRLEHDKTQGIQRPLREEVAAGSESRRRVPVLLIAALVFSAGIGLGAAALFLWPGSLAGGDEQPQAVAPPVAAVEQVQKERKKERPKVVASARPAKAESPRRQTGEQAQERTAAKPVQRNSSLNPRAQEPAQEPVQAPAPPAVSQNVAVVRRIEPQTLGMDGGAAEPHRTPRSGEVRPAAEALKQRPPAPSFQTLSRGSPSKVPVLLDSGSPEPEPAADEPEGREAEPQPARSGVPVILVSRTRWHPQSDRREALIEIDRADGPEQRRVREGDAVGPLVVSRIEPSGVVFLYEDVELRHGVGR